LSTKVLDFFLSVRFMATLNNFQVMTIRIYDVLTFWKQVMCFKCDQGV